MPKNNILRVYQRMIEAGLGGHELPIGTCMVEG